MAVFEEGLYSFISGLGLACASRIYPLRLPLEVVLPAMTYQMISDPKNYTQSGQDKLCEPRYQFNSWGANYADAKTLAEAFITAIGGYKGSMGAFTVYASFAEDSRDNVDPVTGRCWVSVDVIIANAS